MESCVADLRSKEVINVQDGARMGLVGDVIFQTESAVLTHLVVEGPRSIKRLGRRSLLRIPWSQVQTIGRETILVLYLPPIAQETQTRWPPRWLRKFL